MSITIVVGGQFGSEGKGKTTSLLAREHQSRALVVRCGGPNSGHIVLEHDREYVFRHVPSGVVYGNRGLMAPASLVNMDVLRQELLGHQITEEHFGIDPSCLVVTQEHREQEIGLSRDISSTGSGVGAATAAKVMRSPETQFVKDVLGENEWLKPYVCDVRTEMDDALDGGSRIILEGTQGFGLSLHHSGRYPHTTSKDTSAAQFVMEAGLSPLLVDEIVMVVRTFPIRVAGQSGELPNEITWDVLQKESGYPTEIQEFTTVTRKLRRVGRFDLSLVLEACRINRPTKLVVHGMDYLDFRNHGVCRYGALTNSAKNFLNMLENATGVPIKYAFTGRPNSAVVIMDGSNVPLMAPSNARFS
jgi:adenylosuccinate synthase